MKYEAFIWKEQIQIIQRVLKLNIILVYMWKLFTIIGIFKKN